MKSFTSIALMAAILLIPSLGLSQVPTVPTIVNQALATGGQEYKVTLGQGVKGFSIQLRGSYDLRLAFSSGGTANAYITIKTNSVATYYSPFIAWDGVLYLRCEEDNQVVEIEYWR